ncbi:MAG: histidine kinase dimerization/phospho-acceptor domain-containing protein, partial [Candidatus Binatia bacterium]
MSPRRLLTRVDVRLALYLAGLTAVFTSALLCGLLAYALKESLEEQVARADDMIVAIDREAPGITHVTTPHPGVSWRARGADGRELDAGGSWPSPTALRYEVSVWTALFARADEYIVRERHRSDGGVVQVAAPLKHFVRERGELTSRTIIVVLCGFLGSIVLGVVSARRALRPLRDTTAAIRAIDPQRLADRIPLRGNGDDVDALTLATNEGLARLEAAFTRLAAFSADAAHELRTPVNRILNIAEVALTTTDDPTAKDDALAGVRDTADAMRRSIDQLLLLARGEDGGLPLTRDDVDLGAMIAGLGELYAPAAERLDKQL